MKKGLPENFWRFAAKDLTYRRGKFGDKLV
jgi:hypothetical protein